MVQTVEEAFPTEEPVQPIQYIKIPVFHLLDSRLLQFAMLCPNRISNSPIKFILAKSFNCLVEFLILCFSGCCHTIPVFLLETSMSRRNNLAFSLHSEEILKHLKYF